MFSMLQMFLTAMSQKLAKNDRFTCRSVSFKISFEIDIHVNKIFCYFESTLKLRVCFYVLVFESVCLLSGFA